MKITISSVFVNDQDKALAFYTDVLGFKKNDTPLGEHRWLTVVSADDPDGTELLLEPNANPVAKTYQQGIYKQGIPATSLSVDNLDDDYNRLTEHGVAFTVKPTKADWGMFAIFNDTCGNLICLTQAKS